MLTNNFQRLINYCQHLILSYFNFFDASFSDFLFALSTNEAAKADIVVSVLLLDPPYKLIIIVNDNSYYIYSIFIIPVEQYELSL